MQALVRRIRRHRHRNSLDVASYLRLNEGSDDNITESAMNNFSPDKLEEIRQQMSLHRNNLLCACRLSIRRFVEKAHSEGVDDSCAEFKNLATILEHILSHRLKGQVTWFGLEESREFWDFISAICGSLPHNCLDSIATMEEAKSAKAKGRAWIRSALMEKRLAEYIQHTLKDEKGLKAFFGEGAFMRSAEARVVGKELEKLNTIDFSSCLKGEKLETGVAHVIDYASYLQILLRDSDLEDSTDSMQSSASIMTEHNSVGGHGERQSLNAAYNTVDYKYSKLQEQYRVVCAQKDYMEGLVQERDHHLAGSQIECKHLQRALKQADEMARHEHQQLQKTIIQLQAKITHLEEARHMSRRGLEEHLIAGQWSPPVSASSMVTSSQPCLPRRSESISLENLHVTVPNELPSPDGESVQSLDPSIGAPPCDSPTSGTSSASLYNRSDSDKGLAFITGQRSMAKDKEETQSLIPLAGSFTSQMSVRSTETNSSGMLDSDTHLPFLYQARPLSPGSTSSDSCVSADVNHPLVVS
ncbi:RUN domain-containing protein 3B-like [Asterias rubens]|uniref:RUN domain-containing protein 3B-like n=1 Tax=Asterias rubens TaxID=7604 RepID=UPI0014557D85|nr:RUN domain-containing protein 3B-like [Asterias rubens]